MDVISSWSSGKDSCLALYKTMSQGHTIRYLLNFISKEYKRCCFHGIDSELIQLQSNSIGIPLIQKEVSPDMNAYESEFKEAVSALKEKNIRGMVFGDIYLDEHREWVERVCHDLEITPIEPLWNIPAEKILREFLDLGFTAIVVSCKADILGKKYVGRIVDYRFLEELKEKKICVCGENGEFHTFVVDGPCFKKKIEITKTKKILKQGFWKHWYLDIQDWHAEEKIGEKS